MPYIKLQSLYCIRACSGNQWSCMILYQIWRDVVMMTQDKDEACCAVLDLL